MTRLRNILLYVLVFTVLVLSFVIPKVLLQFENNNIEIGVYDKQKVNKLDVEAQNIYLVKAIHDIEEGATIEINRPTNQFLIVEKSHLGNYGLIKNVNEEIIKLEECKILKDFNENDNCKISLINKNYQKDRESYSVNHIILDFDDKQYLFNMETKTGKMIYMAFDKKDLCDENNKEQILKNYISYLNLVIVDDWRYEVDENDKNFVMESKKAGLTVSLKETDESYIFSVHISSKFRVVDVN